MKKHLRLLLATGAVIALSGAARADLVQFNNGNGGFGTCTSVNCQSFVDVGAQGFGNAPRLLTEQTNGFESGSVTPVDVVHGDAVSGSNKSTTPTLGTLGWATGGDVKILFNSDQSSTGITIQNLTLTIFDSNGAALQSFSTPNHSFTYADTELALEPGNGNAGFLFVLDAAQRLTFNALNPDAAMYAGLAATLGCAANAPASCEKTNDGPDSFRGVIGEGNFTTAVPLPGAIWLFGAGLLGMIGLGRKQKMLTGRAA